jgi:hypothetical protein
MGPDSAAYAIWATSGSPASSDYRSADVFELTRRTDGAAFQWNARVPPGSLRLETGGAALAAVGNYQMPWLPTGGKLGRRDLTPGVYDLRVVGDGDTIRVSVELPPVPLIRTSLEPSGKLRFDWPRGSGYFILYAPTDARPITATRDTTYVLQEDLVTVLPIERVFRLAAVDSNYYRFATDSSAASVNVGDALGLVGAFADVTLSVDSVRAALRPSGVIHTSPSTSRGARSSRPPRQCRQNQGSNYVSCSSSDSGWVAGRRLGEFCNLSEPTDRPGRQCFVPPGRSRPELRAGDVVCRPQCAGR